VYVVPAVKVPVIAIDNRPPSLATAEIFTLSAPLGTTFKSVAALLFNVRPPLPLIVSCPFGLSVPSKVIPAVVVITVPLPLTVPELNT
jgi:hypothetical protein